MAENPATFLKKKIGGLPVGIWLLIIVAGIGVGLYIRNRAVDTQVGDAEDLEGDEAGADIVPIDSLPSEDPGYFPATGGGPPSVYGGGALRLDPGVLRIKIIRKQPKKKKKNGGGKNGNGHGHGSGPGDGGQGGGRNRRRATNAFNADGSR